jgi:hypothetical protein
MRTIVVTFLSVAMLSASNAHAGGSTGAPATERAAVESIVDTFVKKLKSEKGFDSKHWQIVLCKLAFDESGLMVTPEGKSGSGSWSMGDGTYYTFGPPSTETAHQQAMDFAVARIKQQLPWAQIERSDLPGSLNAKQSALGIGVGEAEFVGRGGDSVYSGYRGKLVGLLYVGSEQERIDSEFAPPAHLKAVGVDRSAHYNADRGLLTFRSCGVMVLVIVILCCFLKFSTRQSPRISSTSIGIGLAVLAVLALLALGLFSVRPAVTAPSPRAMISR